jgi:hypothetical protein
VDKFAYVVTVTPAGSLLVNGAPAAPTDGSSSSSESQLAWALDQVRRQWEVAGASAGEGSLLTVTIDDQRPGGYGRHRTKLRPGQAASIEGLRARTGKNLEHWSPSSPAEQGSGSTAAAPITSPAPKAPETAPATSGSPTPVPATPVAPASAPPASVSSTWAPSPVPPADAAATVGGSVRIRKQKRPAGETGRGAQQTRLLGGLFGRKSESVDPSAGPAPAGDAPPRPGWTRYTPRVLRPKLPEPEKAAPKQRESPVKMIMVVAATLIIAFLAFTIYDRATQPGSYAAVCVDQRTASRVNTDAPCKQSQAAYFRWWYVPAGSAVPAVGSPVDPQQGSFIEPTDTAPVRYGYAAGGGVYKQPKD